MAWGLPEFKPSATYGNDVRKYFADRNPLATRNTIQGKTEAFNRNAVGDFSNASADLRMAGGGGLAFPQTVQNNLNTGYLDQLRGLASNKDRWEMSQRNLAQSQANQASQSMQNQAASGLATAQGNLAMRGGLTSGAAERMGQNATQQRIMGQQGIGQQLSDQQLAISGAADQRQRALLGQLGDAELGAAKYGTAIDTWNAAQQNQAARNEILASAIGRQNISSGGGGGGFFDFLNPYNW